MWWNFYVKYWSWKVQFSTPLPIRSHPNPTMIYFPASFKGKSEGDTWISNIFMYVGIMSCCKHYSTYLSQDEEKCGTLCIWCITVWIKVQRKSNNHELHHDKGIKTRTWERSREIFHILSQISKKYNPQRSQNVRISSHARLPPNQKQLKREEEEGQNSWFSSEIEHMSKMELWKYKKV